MSPSTPKTRRTTVASIFPIQNPRGPSLEPRLYRTSIQQTWQWARLQVWSTQATQSPSVYVDAPIGFEERLCEGSQTLPDERQGSGPSTLQTGLGETVPRVLQGTALQWGLSELRLRTLRAFPTNRDHERFAKSHELDSCRKSPRVRDRLSQHPL